MSSFGQNLTQFLMSDEMAELSKKISDDILKSKEENKQSCIKYQRHLSNSKDAEITMHNEWLKKDVWNLYNEALPLAVGIHPNCWEVVKNLKDKEFRILQAQAHKIKELMPSCVGYSLIIQNIDDKARHWKVKPSNFISWIEGKGISINSLLDACFMELTDTSADGEDAFKYWALESKDKDTKTNNKIKQSNEDKALCRARAQELWNKNPNMTITAMANIEEIQKYCNGRLYKIRTIKGWINDLAPNAKPGRPSKN